MEKYGFVYIWRDRKHKRFYIGSHWGSETDKYICSSRWMKASYKRRPTDFKRRILARIYTTRMKLYLEEERWIGMIKREEIKKRYYNLSLGSTTHWTSTGNKSSIGERISKGRKKHYEEHPESREAARSLKLKYWEEHPEALDPMIEKNREALLKHFESPEAHEVARGALVKRYENPEAHEVQRKANIKRYLDPEAHEIQRLGSLKRWGNPEARESQSDRMIKYYGEHPKVSLPRE